MRVLAEELFEHSTKNDATIPSSLRMNKRFGNGEMTTDEVRKGVWLRSYDILFGNDMCLIPEEQEEFHDYIWIYICLSGSVSFTFKSGAFQIKTGHSAVQIDGQDDVCVMEEYKKNNRCRSVGVLFDRNTFYNITGRNADEIHRLSKLELSGQNRLAPTAMLNIAEQFLKADFKGVDSKLYIEAKVLEFIAYKLGSLDKYRTNAGEPESTFQSLAERVKYATELLEEMMADPPGIFDLARYVGLNHNKLIKGFKDFFGLSPYEYLSKIRLQKAARLISSREQNVTEAAFSVGYSNLSHFAKIFRNEFGVNPKDYSRHKTTSNKPLP